MLGLALIRPRNDRPLNLAWPVEASAVAVLVPSRVSPVLEAVIVRPLFGTGLPVTS